MVTAFAAALGDIYGPKTTVYRGKLFDYLGMDLDFETIPGCLLVSMIKYLQKVMEECPEQITSTKSNPASDNLFKIRDDDNRKSLSYDKAKQFLYCCVEGSIHTVYIGIVIFSSVYSSI